MLNLIQRATIVTKVCGYNGQIQIITDDDGKLVWECPNCSKRDQDKMNVQEEHAAISEHSSGIRAYPGNQRKSTSSVK